MERRALLKDVILLGLGATLPIRSLLAGGNDLINDYSSGSNSADLHVERSRENTGAGRPFHRFNLGDLELTVVTDGLIRESPVQPIWAPNIPKTTVDSLLKNSFRPTTEIDLGLNVLVIRKGNRTILVDSGTGTGYAMDFGKNSGWLLASLRDAGITPEQITDVVISHAHPDHIGGIFNKDGSRAFPGAQIYLSAVEYKFWTGDHPDFSKSQLINSPLIKVMLPAIQQILRDIKDEVHLFNDGDDILGCIRLQLAPGHTPGHTVTHVYSGSEEIVHIADLLHSDVLQFPHAEWSFVGDTNVPLAASTRARVLANLADTGKKVFAYHLPWPGMGHVRRKGNAFEWVMETYPIPD